MGINLIVGKAIENVLDRLIRFNYKWAVFVPTGRVLTLDLKRWRLEPKVIFDVGANEGQTALHFKRHFKTSEIYSFEPVSEVFDLLTEHSKFSDIKCFKNALGDEKTIKKIFKSASYSGVASIKGAQQAHLSDEEDVQVITGESICKELGVETIDLLKIDTEGYELDVLRGFGPLLTKSVKMVFAETGFIKNNPCQTYISDLTSYMFANGFIVSGVYNQFRFADKKKELHHCDILFMNTHIVDV